MRIVTCEHGGNRVPAAWASQFVSAAEALASHRGYDPGALPLARLLARRLCAPLCASTVSRLLVDLNRSRTSRTLFSQWSRDLSPGQRERVLSEHYHPYRSRVERCVADAVADAAGRGPVLHLSVHSFTPFWNGSERAVDVGFLYDPRRSSERRFCADWKRAIERVQPELRVRLNNPYRGAADGLTTHLRRRFGPDAYQGVELEVSQGIVSGEPRDWQRLRRTLATTLVECCEFGHLDPVWR